MGEGVTGIEREEVNALLLSMRDEGQVSSWERLYEVLRPFAGAMTHGRGLDAWTREDVVQESFVRLKHVCARYSSAADGLSFYSAILRNVIREHLAAKRRAMAICRRSREQGMQRMLDGTATHHLPADLGDWRSPLIAEDALLVALGKLSPLLAQAIELRVIGGLPCKQAAETARCSVATMRKRTSRAITALRCEIVGKA
jgi:RNA polymerase sigma factor (sigma-70 family)